MGARPRKPVTTPETRDRRIDLRVAVDTYIRAAVAHEASGRRVHGWVRNLSTGGMYLETPDPLPAETPVSVDLMARHGREVIHLRTRGWVARRGPDGLGLQFEPPGEEMAVRLEALIARFERA